MVPWVNICNAAPVSPVAETVPATPATEAMPTRTYPMWLIEL